ncbi:hypothetical protein Trydic_g4668 [Trypoxylus dichotomus]
MEHWFRTVRCAQSADGALRNIYSYDSVRSRASSPGSKELSSVEHSPGLICRKNSWACAAENISHAAVPGKFVEYFAGTYRCNMHNIAITNRTVSSTVSRICRKERR